MADGGEKPRGTILSVSQVASLTGRSTQWVHQLVKAGFIPKEGHGKYTLVGIIRGIIAYYEDLQSKNQKTAAASRATDARTREIELRIKERSRELIPLEDARAELADWSSAVRAEFQGLPARYTRDMKERRRLEQEIDGAFERLSRRTSAAGEGAVSAEPEA
jgi:phage terminase Nu1 subunit (DNA packaging protein)